LRQARAKREQGDCCWQLSDGDFAEMVRERQARWLARGTKPEGIENFGQMMYFRTFAAAFSREMNRSKHAMLQTWTESGSAAAG
jgi:hypothetical protein